MSEFNEKKNSAKRAEEFLQVFKKGAEFTRELLKENDRLRYQLLREKELQNGNEAEDAVTFELSQLQKKSRN